MNILLYSPHLYGHPQVYCRVITDILLEKQCKVILAVGLAEEYGMTEWSHIKQFFSDSRVEIIDCAKVSANKSRYLTIEELVGLQKRFKIEATLFIEADKSKTEFLRIYNNLSPRLINKNVGIFSLTNKWYPGEDAYSGKEIKWYGPTVKATLGKFKRAIFNRKQTDKYFFEDIIIKNKIVDSILVKDERLAECFKPPVYYMPEIYRPFNAFESPEEKKKNDELISKFLEFLNKCKGMEILLYFGTGEWYKGYDYFLKLVEMDTLSCGVHFGGKYVNRPGKKYEFDIEMLRNKLLSEGRLFESQCYIYHKRLTDICFSSIKRMVSTHRLTLTSATVLQALEAGKPVLAPNVGLLGYRIKKNNLGMTYTYGDIDDLYRKWILFKKCPPEDYLYSINEFMKKFDKEHLSDCFYSVLLNT